MIDLDSAPAGFKALDVNIKRRGINSISSRRDFEAIRDLCAEWHRDYRPRFVNAIGGLGSVLSVDSDVDWLRSRVNRRTAAADVRARLRSVVRSLERDVLPAYDTARWSAASGAEAPSESTLATKLRELDPGLAASYSQASQDLADPNRMTYLGPAAELREVLRGTVDRLSPDDAEIKAEPWFKGYEGRPTQAEKIRSILGSKERSEQPARSLEIIDEAVGAVGRSTYTRASRSVHTSAEHDRDEVVRIQQWVDVVLAELLR